MIPVLFYLVYYRFIPIIWDTWRVGAVLFISDLNILDSNSFIIMHTDV